MPSFATLYEKYKEVPQKLISELSKETIEERNTQEYIDEYEGKRERRIKSVGNRLPKTVPLYEGEDELGNPKKIGTKSIIPAQLVFGFPKKIVRTATHFIFGGNMSVTSSDPTDGFGEFKSIWEDSLKMQAILKRLARTCMVETKAAVIFYPQPKKVDGKDVTKLRVKLINKKAGEFFPHFDDFGDMDAFTYKYEIIEDGSAKKVVEVYTEEYLIRYRLNGTDYGTPEVVKNLFGKIPVVYVEQDRPEWEEVVSLIDDFEMRISRLSDTNDYMGEPLLKIFGKAAKMPDKNEVGKMLEFEMTADSAGKVMHGDAEYATWDHTPESIKVELDTVREGIFSMTSTPDLSFENMKGIGALSGTAIQMMFMDAFIKREDKLEIFGDAVTRCISVVKAGIQNITKLASQGDKGLEDISVEFNDVLPSDFKELIDSLVAATGGKAIISQETAASQSPFTSDAREEIKRIREDEGMGIPNESFKLP